MQLNIPDELIVNELANSIINIVLAEVEKRLALLTRAIELPPYSNRTEVKKILKIGDEMLNSWIAEGLPIIPWSKKEDKFDRDDIKAHINSMKIVGEVIT
jgi:hypothetical protein